MKITDDEIRQHWFENHVATYTKLNEKVSILEWKEPGTRCYYVRYVMDGNMLYISGDLGDAVFDLTWDATPESFKDIGLHYFYEKLSAYGSDKKDFDSDQAIKDLEEVFAECEEEKDLQLFEDLKELANECCRLDEWAYEVRERLGSELEDFDQDYWEWIYDIGAVIPSRIRAYLVGLKMATAYFEQNKKYYIVSNKWTKGLNRTFWGPNDSGYTISLDEAGIYTAEDVEKDKKHTPLITKDNISDSSKYDSFYIAVEDVELLGKRFTSILN